MERITYLLLILVIAPAVHADDGAAVTAIGALGGRLREDDDGHVVEVTFGGRRDVDAGLAYVKRLTNLKSLRLGSSQVSDAGLVQLAGLGKLESLDLHNTQVTDAGLVHLQGLTGLKMLRLYQTQVTDVGLEQLRGLSNLE
jgi:internalin A